VDTAGETALIFLGGQFSHAVRKGPLLRRSEGARGDRDSRGDLMSSKASAEALLVASLLCTRVDVVVGNGGRVLLLELELTELSLCLPQEPEAAGRFAVPY